jgi:hypothetical protein
MSKRNILNRALTAATACLIVTAPAFARDPNSGVVNVPSYPTRQRLEQPAVHGAQLSSGTRIQARVEGQINSRSAHPGDSFTLRVAQPVRDSRGQIAIPAGAQLVGSVMGADRNMWSPAHIALAIEGIRVGSNTVPLPARVIDTQTHTFRAGLRMRNYVRLDPGSRVTVETTAPVSVSALHHPHTQALGGGPKGWSKR